MPENVFWGRTRELQELQGWDRQRSLLTVVYGRRRVGKTRLLDEAFANHRYLRIDGLEGLSQSDQKLVFCQAVSRFAAHPAFLDYCKADWLDIFQQLSRLLGREPAVLALDEFQWLAGERGALVSKLKHAWDNLFSRENCLHLILCGSVSSFMVNRVLRSKALFGRVEKELHVRPLALPEIVPDLTRHRDLLDVIEVYLHVGGIPQYLRLYDWSKSPRLNLEELYFRENAYFVNEFERLFASHFGRNAHYRGILEYLAGHGRGDRNDLARACGLPSGGRVSEYLENLETAGFIEQYFPVDKPQASRNGRFRILDPYLDFYFRFVRPNLALIRQPGGAALPKCLPDSKYYAWRGLAFERLGYTHRHLIAARLGFAAVAYRAGAWFQRQAPGFQLDLVYDRADRVLTVCELKFLNDKVGKDVIAPAKEQLRRLPPRRGYTIEPVLITATEPTAELVNEGFFNRILTVQELFAGRAVPALPM